MQIAFITVGDPARLTGGYLYHARVFPLLRERGLLVDEIVASAADGDAQQAAAVAFGTHFNPLRYTVIVVDALARTVCAPWLDAWRRVGPLVAMVHELPSVANADQRQQAAEAPLLRADLLITVSNHGRAILLERAVASDRIRIVSPGRDRIDAMPGTPQQSPRIVLCVAQWIPRKSITTLVQAWGARARPDARLVLVGETTADPVYTAEVQSLIAATRMDALIEVRGAVDDSTLHTLYQCASLFVLPTRYEGYGMAYAEALSYGLPVIGSAVGPVPELVGDAGLLVPPDSVDNLDTAITALLTDTTRCTLLRQAALAQAARLPTWATTARQFQAVLEEAATLQR